MYLSNFVRIFIVRKNSVDNVTTRSMHKAKNCLHADYYLTVDLNNPQPIQQLSAQPKSPKSHNYVGILTLASNI